MRGGEMSFPYRETQEEGKVNVGIFDVVQTEKQRIQVSELRRTLKHKPRDSVRREVGKWSFVREKCGCERYGERESRWTETIYVKMT